MTRNGPDRPDRPDRPDVDLTARLAGITTLSLGGRGPSTAFVFDPHRLALPCWALAGGGRPVLLLTLDRHFDLVAPRVVVPSGATVLELDEFARRSLDVRNFDHILAAFDAGVVSDVIAVARASPVGAFEGARWRDAHGVVRARVVDTLSADYGTARASPESREAERRMGEASRIVLDLDLDCFTSPSDADPTTVLPWPKSVIRDYLLPSGSEAFWSAVLSKCVALTLAREPNHCGGLVAGGRLFEDVADVVFRELLGTDVP